jgi:hypothetical protein
LLGGRIVCQFFRLGLRGYQCAAPGKCGSQIRVANRFDQINQHMLLFGIENQISIAVSR